MPNFIVVQLHYWSFGSLKTPVFFFPTWGPLLKLFHLLEFSCMLSSLQLEHKSIMSGTVPPLFNVITMWLLVPATLQALMHFYWMKDWRIKETKQEVSWILLRIWKVTITLMRKFKLEMGHFKSKCLKAGTYTTRSSPYQLELY